MVFACDGPRVKESGPGLRDVATVNGAGHRPGLGLPEEKQSDPIIGLLRRFPERLEIRFQ